MSNNLRSFAHSVAGVAALTLLVACGSGQPAEAQNPPRSTAGLAPANAAGLAQATFAGGCFWAQEEVFEELKGVKQVVSGYTGGTKANPTYEEVAAKNTGHTEAVAVYYDPKLISYQTLADVFFRAAHDPTQLGRQGYDVGPEYRSAAFYRTPEEKKTLEATIARVNASKQYGDKVVTEVLPLTKFWPAEDYHQGYFRLHPDNPYISNVSQKKVDHVRQEFPQLLKQPL